MTPHELERAMLKAKAHHEGEYAKQLESIVYQFIQASSVTAPIGLLDSLTPRGTNARERKTGGTGSTASGGNQNGQGSVEAHSFPARAEHP